MNTYIMKPERFPVNSLSFHLMTLEKEEHIEPKASRRKEIRKITVEINRRETRKTVGKIPQSQKLVLLFKKLTN